MGDTCAQVSIVGKLALPLEGPNDAKFRIEYSQNQVSNY